MPNVHDRVTAARQRLRAAGVPAAEADLDARLLAEFTLGWDTATFVTSGHEPEPADFAEKYDSLIARRVWREPIAYITGRQEFWGLRFDVTPAVLIPRPETELIVETALELFSNPDAALEIADVGTGSGCLAVALARERPRARLVAIDVSDDALEIARRNAERHGVDGRIELVQADLLTTTERRFDLIVSNPPYVPETDRETLQPEVRDREPPLALFAGGDGLAVIRRIADQSVTHLKTGGVLIFELGLGQADAVRELIGTTSGLRMIEINHDLQGIPRVAVACRS